MFVCSEKNTGEDHNMKICNKSFKRVYDFNYLVTTLTIKIVVMMKLEHITFRESLPSFGAESFVLHFANYNTKIKIEIIIIWRFFCVSVELELSH